MTFGEKLKNIRLERGMTQEEFATFLNTSKQVISRYETNQRIPKITVAYEYSQRLNLPLIDLICESHQSEHNSFIEQLKDDLNDFTKDELREIYQFSKFIKQKREQTDDKL